MVAERQIDRPYALVSMEALRHNIGVIRAVIPPGVRICAVLKADAYGHSAPNIARELAGSGARRQPLVDAVAVATFDEAEALGRMSVPVYVMRPIEGVYLGAERKRLEEAIRVGWVMSVNSVAAARDLARVATSMKVPALVQISVDTGMARGGAPMDQFDAIASAIIGHASLRLVSLATHFVASEDQLGESAAHQLSLFHQTTDPCATANPTLVRHAANTGGILIHPSSHLDMVRPGKALYGIHPTPSPMPGFNLRPILKWVAPLLMVRDLTPGQTVGYGATFTAQHNMRIGLVPVGFADGYMRCLSGKGVMLLNGCPTPVIGRVSMDYTTIDLSNVPVAVAGDTVTILDDNPYSPAGIYNLAKLADTIPSELFCGIGARVPRIPTGQQIAVEVLAPRVARVRQRPIRVPSM